MPFPLFLAILASMFTLNAKARNTGEKIGELRKGGMIPAVFYGAGKPNTSISVPLAEFTKVWKEAGESSAITLENGKEKIDVLIHEIQYDPVRNMPTHVDFLAIDMNKEITVSVALEFSGEPEPVRTGLGILVKVLHEVEVTALPKNLPHTIPVDVSALATLDAQIHVKDLAVPAGVTIETGEDEVVALISEAKEEVEEEAAPVDLSAIEVEQKGKKDEEGEGAAEETA